MDACETTQVALPDTALISIRDTADHIGVSVETLKNWYKRGWFPQPIRVGDSIRSRLFFRRSAIESWLLQREEEACHAH
jgi:predicted DNA-binding transcriptional regulator AlpA